MSLPVFFWLLAATLDASLFVLLLRRRCSPMRWLIGYKLVAHVILFALYCNPATYYSPYYLTGYVIYAWGLCALTIWNIQHLANFEPTAVRFALLLAVLAAVVSMYCQKPGIDLTTTLLRTADRLHWLAPTSLLIWGMIESPPQISRRNSITYFGFSMWAAGELLRSFAKLAGLATPATAAFYPIAVTSWIFAAMQPEPCQLGKKLPVRVEAYIGVKRKNA